MILLLYVHCLCLFSGRNCLHMLAATHKDNSPLLFEMLMRVAPKFPLDRQDIDGNTPLLLAYHCGSTALCDSLVQYSAHPGIANKQNISIFNAPVATKQLLFRILGNSSVYAHVGRQL